MPTDPPDGDGTEPLTGSARGQFGRGRDPLERLDGSPGRELVRVEAEGSEPLRSMRHVVLNANAKTDRTPTEKAYRKVFNKNPASFLARLEKLEAAVDRGAGGSAGGATEAAPSAPPPPADLGTAKLIELAREKLRRLRGAP